jgi:hypothetical protein
MNKHFRLDQLLAAARTVTNATPRNRRVAILEQLARHARRRSSFESRTALFYLTATPLTGEIPPALWD